ncbi:hypothetical protein BJ322DRAFT_801156 [Thelephora terrestris]|uniref:F-box domain-containing protein n=1 Tax=Thelephora terrestris TaxID=56493 RepID=A0A9P6HEB5_9AGAM|nr:hypothetical protein BJ322DRAFT_801156 [Thelephora terrestris]
MTTPAPADWQNTGTFGPEQADLDVAYATSLPPEASLAWVEARLAEVQSHLANLGAGRNMLIPIYHLPRIVLVQIFSWVALSHPSSKSEKDLHRFPMNQTKDLMHISHACKLFRDAALHRQELWVRVNLKYPDLAKAFLDRSGDKPVTVFLYPPRPEGRAVKRRIPLEASTLEILRPHLTRITNLDLTFTTQSRSRHDVGDPLAMHMPALETLQVRNVWKEGEDVEGFDPDSPEVLPPVFSTPNEPYPRLRKVTLMGIDAPWDSSLFNGLTELNLSLQTHEHAPKLEEFLKVLAQCPGLEKLHLWNSGPKELPDSPTTPYVETKVRLPHLQDLSIIQDRGRYMDTPLLLSGVSIPPSAKIHIQCNEAIAPIIPFSVMFPPGHPFIAELPKYGTFKHLHSFTFFHFRLIDESGGGSLSFRVNRQNQSVPAAASILDFFKAFGESARYAEIYPGSDGNPWVQVLRTLPNVESLRMKRELDHGDFVSASSTEVCPKLKKLAFEYYSHTADHQSKWLAVVKARAANGMKLEEFNLTFAQGEEFLTAEAVSELKLYTGKFSRQKI